MATANAYGTFNPRGLEPNPIETTLAQAAITSPASAQTLLNQYQAQRQAAEGQYGAELSTQHDYARQQLANQLYENQLKAMTEATKTPGALDLIASSPQFGGMLAGIDPGVLGRVSTNLQRSQFADTLQKGGAGLASLDTAGFQVPGSEASAVTGLDVTPGISRAEKVATIAANARRDAARIGASGSGGVSFSVPLPNQPILGGLSPSMSVGKHGTVQQGLAEAQRQGFEIPQQVQPPSAGAQPRGATNLQPLAKQDTGKAVSNTAPGAQDIQKQAQTVLENVIRTQNPQAYADVKAAQERNGGKVVLQQDKNGTVTGFVGLKGIY